MVLSMRPGICHSSSGIVFKNGNLTYWFLMGIGPGELPNFIHRKHCTEYNYIIYTKHAKKIKHNYKVLYGTCEPPLGAKFTTHGSKMPAVERFQYG